jgi:hypothetical protein
VAAALPRMSARATCPVLVGRRGHRLSRPRPACTCTAPAPSRIHPGPCRPSVHPLLPVTPGGATRGAAATARRLPRVARGRGLVVWSLVWAGVGRLIDRVARLPATRLGEARDSTGPVAPPARGGGQIRCTPLDGLGLAAARYLLLAFFSFLRRSQLGSRACVSQPGHTSSL